MTRAEGLRLEQTTGCIATCTAWLTAIWLWLLCTHTRNGYCMLTGWMPRPCSLQDPLHHFHLLVHLCSVTLLEVSLPRSQAVCTVQPQQLLTVYVNLNIIILMMVVGFASIIQQQIQYNEWEDCLQCGWVYFCFFSKFVLKFARNNIFCQIGSIDRIWNLQSSFINILLPCLVDFWII